MCQPDRRRPDRGARRRHRLGQVHAHQPAGAAARAAARHRVHRRRRRARHSARACSAARSASSRRSRFSSPTRSADNIAFGVPASGGDGQRRGDARAGRSRRSARQGRRGLPDGLRHVGRRARHHAFRRPEAADGARARGRVDPRILVLDDALSAVDTYTEEEILSRLRGSCSSARPHRLAPGLDRSRRRSDPRAREGRIVERGTHDELVAARRALRGPAIGSSCSKRKLAAS